MNNAMPHYRARLRTVLAFVVGAFVSACSNNDSLTQPKLHPTDKAAMTALAATAPNQVLILSSTLANGASSREVAAVTALGDVPVMVSDAQWSSMTAADFSSYRAIVFGDPRCSGGFLGAAIANRGIWGPAVNGNVFILGTDPVFHADFGGNAGAAQVIRSGISFAASSPTGQTGAYLTMSCDPGSVSALGGLSTLGSFTTTSAGTCYNNVVMVAASPSLLGLTNASLSNWGCSVHVVFNSWPSDFDVLAIATDGTPTYTATTGQKGAPYILARGAGLVIVSDIALTPATATKDINSTATISATVKSNGAPVVGTTVRFTLVDGPHAGTTATATTDGNGVATYSFTSAVEGVDGVRATFVDAATRTQTSNRATVTWTKPSDVTAPVVTHTISSEPNAAGWFSSDVSVTFSATDAESAVTTTGCEAQSVTTTTSVDGVTFTCTAVSAGGTTVDKVTIKLDKTVPTVTGSIITGTKGANDWYIDNVVASWTTSTAGPSGQTSSADCAQVTLTTDAASHTFTCTITTGAGISSAQGKVSVKRDAQTPTIQFTRTGTIGSESWYVSDVGVLWTTAAGPSGVNSCTSAPVSTDGTNITFSCTATAGNGKTASVTTPAVKRDATRPTVAYAGNASSYTVDQMVSITCTPSDNLSGVASSTCSPITGAAFTFALGNNGFSAQATDHAGNVSSTASTSFTVGVTDGSLCELVKRFSSNAGVANSLCVNLSHQDYLPFRNELAAQSGKKISTTDAATLLRLVNALDPQ